MNTPGGSDGRQLGRELRKLREGAGLTQARVAEVLGCGQAKVNKIERNLLRVNGEDLEKLIRLYAVEPAKAAWLREVAARQPRRRPLDSPKTWPAYEEMTDLELDARVIRGWYSEALPVPLCSEPYMLRRLHNYQGTLEGVTELLRRREARAEIFLGEQGPECRMILSESALRRMPGGCSAELVIEQMEHMINLVDGSKRLTLHVLPFSAPVDVVDTAFTLLRFPPDKAEKDLVYVEYVSNAKNIRNAAEVDMFEEHWDVLRDAALSPADSLVFIDDIARRARADCE